MSATGMEVFDTTLQRTLTWLKDIETELGWDDRHRSYLALRACLHQLRDRLTVEEAAHLSAQLPLLVRGIYYEGWDPTKNPTSDRTVEDFTSGLLDYFPNDLDLDYEEVMRCCLRVMSRHVDAGITRHIRDSMPRDIAALWED